MIKKYNTLNVRLTKEEVQEFRNIAIEVGSTQSDLIRKRVLQQSEIMETIHENHEDFKTKLEAWLDYYISINIESLEQKILSTLATSEKTKLDTVEELIDIDKSLIDNFMLYDIIEDTKLKSWILFKKDNDKNTLELMKYPILKEKNSYVKINLNDTDMQNLIHKVYRQEANYAK